MPILVHFSARLVSCVCACFYTLNCLVHLGTGPSLMAYEERNRTPGVSFGDKFVVAVQFVVIKEGPDKVYCLFFSFFSTFLSSATTQPLRAKNTRRRPPSPPLLPLLPPLLPPRSYPPPPPTAAASVHLQLCLHQTYKTIKRNEKPSTPTNQHKNQLGTVSGACTPPTHYAICQGLNRDHIPTLHPPFLIPCPCPCPRPRPPPKKKIR